MGSVQDHAYRGTAGWRYAAPPDSATTSKSVSFPGSTTAAKRFYQRLFSDGNIKAAVRPHQTPLRTPEHV